MQMTLKEIREECEEILRWRMYQNKIERVLRLHEARIRHLEDNQYQRIMGVDFDTSSQNVYIEVDGEDDDPMIPRSERNDT